MAYNRENLLRRIIEVQDIVLEHRKHDTPQIRIYEKHIKDKFHISYSCFNEWISINAKKELKELLEKKAKQKKIDDMQMTLF